MSSGDFEDDWEPLSEAEMKVIQAKQERSNKISKIMGDYLLKGYKMLASSCDDCGCILLQDKQNQLHCVACNECEVEGSKDDPALSQLAADSKIREGASPGAAAATNGLDSGVDAENASTSAATPRSSSAGLSANGIPALMNASSAVNGNTAVGVAEAGTSLNGASGSGCSGSSGGGGGGGKAPKGKTSSRSSNRASSVGVRSLMSDVGRNAYEAFAAYPDESPSSPAAAAAAVAAYCSSASTPPPSLPPTLPPHGPAVAIPVFNGDASASMRGGGGAFLNGFVSSTIPVSRSPPSAAPMTPGMTHSMTPGRLTPSDHECLTQTLKRKMILAGKQLEKSGSNEEDKALCGLIKYYAEALEAVNRMQSAIY